MTDTNKSPPATATTTRARRAARTTAARQAGRRRTPRRSTRSTGEGRRRQDGQAFFLDGKEVDRARRRDHLAAPRKRLGHRAAASVLFAAARLSRRRQLPRLHGRDRGRARAGGELHPHAGARHEGQDADRPRQDRAQDGRSSFWSPISPSARGRARSGVRSSGAGPTSIRASTPAASPSASRDAGARPQPRRRWRSISTPASSAISASAPAAKCRSTTSSAWPAAATREDRVRLRRSDGRLDLRRLRRMRAGLPDRRADAGDAGRRQQRAHRISRPRRSTASARIAASAASSPTTSRTTSSSYVTGKRRPGQPEPAVRQGPLRLRLRQQSAAPD